MKKLFVLLSLLLLTSLANAGPVVLYDDTSVPVGTADNPLKVSFTDGGGGSSQWSDGASDAIYYNDGNVGIGTSAPVGELSLGDSAVHYVGCSDSIADAITAASAGDTLILGSCTYDLDGADLEISKSLQIKGQGIGKTILTNTGADTNAISISGLATTDFVSIENMSFTEFESTIRIDQTSDDTLDYDNILISNIEIIETADSTTYAIYADDSGFTLSNVYINTQTSSNTANSIGVFIRSNGGSVEADYSAVLKNVIVEAYTSATSTDHQSDAIMMYIRYDNSYDLTVTTYNCNFRASSASSISNGVKIVNDTTQADGGTLPTIYWNDFNSYVAQDDDTYTTSFGDLRINSVGGSTDGLMVANLYGTIFKGNRIIADNDATINKYGAIYSGGLELSGFLQPNDAATVGVSAKNIFNILGSIGGNIIGPVNNANAGNGASGIITLGEGGESSGGNVTGRGGFGGDFTLTGGLGGNSIKSGIANTGGRGGDLNLIGGLGGDATDGSSNTGGRGGNIYLTPGVGGTGATANGASGNVILAVKSDGTSLGNVGIGITSPQNKLDVEGGAVIGTTYSGTNTAPTNGLLVEGSVGIGTTVPLTDGLSGSAIISLQANSATRIGAVLKNASSSNGADTRFVVSNNQNDYMAMFMPSSGNTETTLFGMAKNTFTGLVVSSSADLDKNLLLGLFNAGSVIFGTNNLERMRMTGSGSLGLGTTAPSAKLHTEATIEQLRLGYDASNYVSTTVGSTGVVTHDAVGSGSSFVFSDPVSASALTLPNGTTIPATCTVGQIFHDTDSDDCANTGSGDGALCICKSTNTWALISNF